MTEPPVSERLNVEEEVSVLTRGERPDIEEYVRRYPHVAGVLRQLQPALQTVRESTAEGPVQAGEEQPRPKQPRGDSRIVRELGRAGMGVVYEAEKLRELGIDPNSLS